MRMDFQVVCELIVAYNCAIYLPSVPISYEFYYSFHETSLKLRNMPIFGRCVLHIVKYYYFLPTFWLNVKEISYVVTKTQH